MAISLNERIQHKGVFLPDYAKQLLTEAALESIEDYKTEYHEIYFPYSVHNEHSNDLASPQLKNINNQQVFMIQQTSGCNRQAYDAVLTINENYDVQNIKIIDLIECKSHNPILSAIQQSLERSFNDEKINFQRRLGPVQNEANCSIHSAITFANEAAKLKNINKGIS